MRHFMLSKESNIYNVLQLFLLVIFIQSLKITHWSVYLV